MKKAAKQGMVKALIRRCAQWAGIPVDAGDGTSYNLAGRLESGACVTAGSVLQLAAAWACVSLLSDAISTLPLGFYERTKDGRKAAEDHPLYWVLRRQPNQDMTSAQLIGAIIASLLLWGNCYVEKLMLGKRVMGLKFLLPGRVGREKLPGGGWQYTYTDPNGTRRKLPRDRVMHIPAFSVDGICGLSPIAYGAGVFGAAQAAQDAANSTFEKGLQKTVAFKFPTVLKKEQRGDAREAIENISGALNAGKPAIFEAGMDAMEIGINPSDAQLLESRAFSVEEICSWFRVQPFMIGRASKGQTNWGTGIEQQMIGFVTFTLRPWLARIEQAISKDLLQPEERERYYAEFAIEGLLRGDSAARQAFYSSALQNGWLSRNDVRKLENLPPIDGGDIYTVQAALVPLDQVGQAPTATPAPDSAAPLSPAAALIAVGPSLTAH
jgi:HK97 family phage portal protein